MGKLCIVDVTAAIYRKRIFQLLENEYDCIWMFGQESHGIKGLDLTLLKDVKKAPVKKIFGKFYIQRGAVNEYFDKKITTFLINGEPYCLSSWAIVLLAKLFHKKEVYFWSHGWYGRETFLKQAVKKIYFKLPTGSFIYGDYAKKLMIEEGISEKKLFVIHNSLDYDYQCKLRARNHQTDLYRKHFNNTDANVVFIGRLTQSKRIDLLINAMSNLHNTDQRFNLTIVGEGQTRQALEDIINDLNLNDYTWFYGESYNEDENSELLHNADICVSPGNVGLTAIHSLTYGTPVITHDQFAYQGPEFEAIKEGITGSFFKKDDVDSLTRCIKNWITSHNKDRDEIRRACYEEIDRWWTPEFQMDVFKKHLIVK